MIKSGKSFCSYILCLGILLLACTAAKAADINDSLVKVSTDLAKVKQSDIKRVKKEAVTALNSVSPILGINCNETINIRIVKGGISNSLGGVISLDINRIRKKNAPVVHEVTHIITRKHKRNRFFAEGLAIYFQERFGEDDHGQFSTKRRSLDDWVRSYKKNLIPIGYLINNNNIFRQVGNKERKIAYLEAGSFINYLVETYGEEKLKGLYNTHDLNYEKIYGLSIDELEIEWKKHIFK